MGNSNSTTSGCSKQTPRGRLLGVAVKDKSTNEPLYERYARIRYAMPPLGDRRWRRPQPLPSEWKFGDGNEVAENCRDFGAICPQFSSGTVTLENPERTGIIENATDEDCLFLNIWVPAMGSRPAAGFPVQFDLPGGRHQFGHGMQQDFFDPIDLMRENRNAPRVIVSLNYRVGIFGFLAISNRLQGESDLSKGNFGFWDIRMALEWCRAHIEMFDGDPYNITVGGLGPSTLYQLHYDAFLSASQPIIRRAIFLGDVPILQPELASSLCRKAQIDTLRRRLSIESLGPGETIEELRGKDAKTLLEAAQNFGFGFMPVTDDDFVSDALLTSVYNGDLGRRLKSTGVQVLMGDTSEERSVYAFFTKVQGAKFRFSTTINSYDSLADKLRMSFSEEILAAVFKQYDLGKKDWAALYSDIMADTRTHAPIRGFADGLFEGGMTTEDVFRYQLAWRPSCLDAWIQPAIGICHAIDIPIWWYSGWRAGFSAEDKENVCKFLKPVSRFINGSLKGSDWGTQTREDVRVLDADGVTKIAKDSMWPQQIKLWQAIRNTEHYSLEKHT